MSSTDSAAVSGPPHPSSPCRRRFSVAARHASNAAQLSAMCPMAALMGSGAPIRSAKENPLASNLS
jgi:hypothetical protein